MEKGESAKQALGAVPAAAAPNNALDRSAATNTVIVA
jgi:hypothetical protein